MTLDSTVPSSPSYISQYGCPVTVFPASQLLRIEVWRAPDNGSGVANDAAAVQATVLPPGPMGGVTFIDPLPNDGAKRYYKSRHIDDAGTVSTFTLYSEGLIPELITGANGPNPVAAFGAIVDQMPPSAKYEMRFASSYSDPDSADGMQSFIDFVATTYFLRLGQTPKLVEAATNATPIAVTITGHGYLTGDSVIIRGHLGNTAANSVPAMPWTITVVDNNTFTLNGSVGSGADTPNTGHCVRLSMTIDSVGNLVVYAIIKAYSFVVNGIATFNGVLNSLAGALFRTLQHSTVGNYGDTTVKRVMLKDNNLELRGDAGQGTDMLPALLGSYTIASTSAPTARSSKDVGLTAGSKGWTDPDGVDDGINSLTVARGGNTTVAAASRLWCKLGDPTSEGDNVDAYDDLYALSFKVTAKLTSNDPNSECDATVVVEYSTNSGSSWNDSGTSYTVYGVDTGGSSSVFNPVIVVAGTPSHVWFRLKLNVQTTGLPGGPSGTGTVQCFASIYRTNNYAVTWSTTTGSTQYRRGLKLPKIKQPEQIANAGFESAGAFWGQVNPTVSFVSDATKAHSGVGYMQISTSGAASGDAVATDGVAQAYYAVSVGDVVTFGGWAYRESGTSSVYYLLNTYDASKVLVTSVTGTAQNTAAWVAVSNTFTIPSGTAYVSLFAEVNNVTSTVARYDDASLKIGTGDVPHTYLEPVDIVAADQDAVEGEVQFVGGSTGGPHALAYHDGEKMRYVPKVIAIYSDQSTTSGTEAQIVPAITIKSQRLNAVKRGLRVRLTGRIGANTGTIKLNFNGTGSNWSTISLTSGQSFMMDYTFVVDSTGASAGVRAGGFKAQATTFTVDEGSLTLDLTADLTLDIRGNTTGGVTLTVREITVEWLY